MNRWTKIGVVCAGYVLAFTAAGFAAYLYDRRMAAMPYDTSGGMYAAGQGLSWLAVFLTTALFPTLLALWFLRRNERLWTSIAFAAIGFAVVGLVGVLTFGLVGDNLRHPLVIALTLLGLAQLLGVPLWTVAFAAFAAFAPTHRTRRLLFRAVGIELVIGVCAAIHWFLPRIRF